MEITEKQLEKLRNQIEILDILIKSALDIHTIQYLRVARNSIASTVRNMDVPINGFGEF